MGKGFPFAAVVCAAFVFASGCNNFHEVDEGRFYRSAQLDKKELKKAIKELKIKTVVNLRGASPGKDWYDDEVAVTQSQGVKLIDIRMSAQRLPHQRDLVTLLDAYRNAERPLLVHCQAGADRTGEAAAIYMMEYMGKNKEEAMKMLTLRYLHFEPRFPAKRYFMERYQGEAWARTTYDPCKQAYKYYDQGSYCGPSGPPPDLEVDETAEVSNGV